MKLIETKGTVKFYESENGVQYQQIEGHEPIKVFDGEIKYKHIKTVGDYSIQYTLLFLKIDVSQKTVLLTYFY